MSKKRSVDTHFWNDNYVADLDPIEKILFLYFLTNPLTNMLGVYEIPLRRIAFDTGIDSDMVKKIIERFDRDDKFSYVDGFLVVHNFLNHQNLNTNMKTSAENEFLSLPDNVMRNSKLERVRKALKGLGMLRKIEIEYEYESERELEVESESEREGETESESDVSGGGVEQAEDDQELRLSKRPGGDAVRVNGVLVPEPLLRHDRFVDAYEFYCQYMKENYNRWPTSTTTQMDLFNLAELKKDGNDPVAVIMQTVQARNKSFYPLKRFSNGQNDGKSTEASFEDWLSEQGGVV